MNCCAIIFKTFIGRYQRRKKFLKDRSKFATSQTYSQSYKRRKNLVSPSVACAENSRRGAKFRHNRVTSQINFRTTILGGPASWPGKILQNYTKQYANYTSKFAFAPKYTHTVYTFFIFRVWSGGNGTVPPLRTLVISVILAVFDVSVWPDRKFF